MLKRGLVWQAGSCLVSQLFQFVALALLVSLASGKVKVQVPQTNAGSSTTSETTYTLSQREMYSPAMALGELSGC